MAAEVSGQAKAGDRAWVRDRVKAWEWGEVEARTLGPVLDSLNAVQIQDRDLTKRLTELPTKETPSLREELWSKKESRSLLKEH